MVPSLVDVSSGGWLHQLSRSESVTDDRSLTLSPTTAHARQTTVAAVAAECDAANFTTVTRAYANTSVHQVERVTALISATNWSDLAPFSPATTKTVGTTTGTPNLTRLTKTPHNLNTAVQEALKTVVHRPTR